MPIALASQTIPFGEYRPDLSDLNAGYTVSLNNVLPRADGYGPVKAPVAFTTALAATCRGYFYARKRDNSVAIFAGTSTKLYKLDNTDFTWDDVSLGGGSYSTLSSTAQWQFVQFNDYVIAVQANAAPQVFDLTSSSAFANLGGSPPQAAYIAVVNRFIVLSGLLSQPYRVHWSGFNAPTTWTQGTNYCDYQDLPDGGVVRGIAGGEYGLVLQDQATRRLIYVPGSPLAFQIDRVAQDRGLLAPYALIPAGDKMFGISAQGFWRSDASGVQVPIGKERVDKTFFASYDDANPQLFIGAADPASNIALWAYKSLAGNEGLFDKVLIYDWSLERWSPFDISGEYLTSLSKPGLTLENLDSISASLDALEFSLDDVSTAALPALSIATSAHKVGFFTGSNLEATIETATYSPLRSRVEVNGFVPVTDATSVYGSVGNRDMLDDEFSYTDEAVMNEDGYCPVLAEGRYIRAKVRIPAATSWSYARGVVPDMGEGSQF